MTGTVGLIRQKTKKWQLLGQNL